MPSLTINSVTVHPTTGEVRVRYDGKCERVYASVEAFRRAARANLTRDDLFDLAVGLIAARQPKLGNPAAFAGRSVTVDFSQAAWGTVS